jgi:GT2 family glycosyltransferase
VIAAVIPSKNSANALPCAAAIRACDPGVAVYVIDDGLAEQPAGATILPGIKPFVFSRNVNIGIAAAMSAGAAGVCLMNDDALLQTTGGISILAAQAATDPAIGAIAATCNNVGNRAQWPQGIGLRYEPRMVCFVCVYIPRATIAAIGLLDERFVGYGFEDDDYCKRIRDAGMKIAITDDVYVDHGSLKSSFRGEPRAPGALTENAAIYRAKWGEDNWGRK